MVNRTPPSSRTKLIMRTHKVATNQPQQYRYYLLLFSIQSISLIGLLLLSFDNLGVKCQQEQEQQQQQQQVVSKNLPDLTSGTSDEPIVAIVGQDAFISCVAKNLQNYTIIWRYTNDANAPGATSIDQSDNSTTTATTSGEKSTGAELELASQILTAGRQRVVEDDRFSVIQSHDTWLLKISNVRQADTGTYICHTNSSPRVRVLRILSVLRPAARGGSDSSVAERLDHFDAIDYNFTECCRNEYVGPRCQRLCSFQQLASRYQSINIVHECFSALPSITRCMVAGRNVSDCCEKRHIPNKCHTMCGHQGDTSAMSVQDQAYCADYSASIMSCVAEGINTLPGQPELVIVEAISSTTLKVSWQKVSDEKELAKVEGWIINLTKLSSFEDTISSPSGKKSVQQLEAATASSTTSPSSSPSTQSPQSSNGAATGVGGGGGNSQQVPLASLNIVDVMKNSSLAAMTRMLAAAHSGTNDSTISLKLDKNLNEFQIDNLKPYTVYQIQMFAFNSEGRSQLTDPIRALTLAPEEEQEEAQSANGNSNVEVEPSLPDTRKCCLNGGVTLKRCLDTLCDPIEADRATIADLMICAPWSNVTFSCLSSKINHTDCCKSRGVSPFCLSMCSGEVKRVDYRHFRCLTHMSTYTNCILESHNVLPSPPLNFTVGPITHTWAVLNWRPPKQNSRSLQGYRIYWRRVEGATSGTTTTTTTTGGGGISANNASATSGGRLLSMSDSSRNNNLMGDSSSTSSYSGSDDDFYYSNAEAATNPYLLDALTPATVYETFVVAVNRFGQSESSVRFVFQTLADPEELHKLEDSGATSSSSINKQGEIESRLPQQQSYYNETTCCSNSGVHSSCLQLCDYDVRVTDFPSLVSACNTQMPVILRCMAGSRNSVPCCRNRGVNDQCLNVCAGLTEHSPLVVATRCAGDFGKIIRCMDEGTKQIPSAPVDLHTLDIKSDRITIKWQPSAEDSLRSDIEYHIRYQQLQPTGGGGGGGGDESSSNQQQQNDPSSLIAVVPLHPLEHNLILTTNKTEATIDKLKANTRYSIYVTAENGYGISLPSLVLVAQTPDESISNDPSKLDDYKRRATLGAPHSLELLRSDTESIVLKWIAPLFINNDAQIRYRVFYKLLSSNLASGTSTTSTSSPSNSETTTANEQIGQTQQLASNWTVIETSDTSILLRNLKYSSQYAITVQAFSRKMLGHMSEILIAQTAKPVPPSLNQPLVINSPIEGNNITIMCVALGQPTPQISMFINGLLVQKRTQPYVIYHLVNLVRGHLTITCFASNGHGKEYASVQSRTEVSVRFPAQTVAKVKEVRANRQSTARMSCDISGNPQPTVIWIFTPEGQTVNGTHSAIVVPNERVTTLLVSQFENPFSWSHTLTIRNVSQADIGIYQCRSRNMLAESTDAIRLIASGPISESTSSSGLSTTNDRLNYLKQVEQQSDLMDCCRSQNVSSSCLPVCSPDGLNVEAAFKTPECQAHLDKLMYCAADGSDHRNCCRNRQVPSTCLRWCSGAKLNIPALCFLSSAIDINQCFQEGRSLLPGPPRNVRAMLASDSEHQSDPSTGSAGDSSQLPPTSMSLVGQQMNGMFASAGATGGGVQMDSNNNNNNNLQQQHQVPSSSVISSMATMTGDSPQSTTTGSQQQQQPQPDNQPISEPLIIEWDPPSKNPSLVQYYRVFWRPFGSRELSRTITNLTWIRLNDLNLNKQYELVVKAANSHGSSIYSEPLKIIPADILAQSNAISVGLTWFMPLHGSTGSLFGRVLSAICFATMFMFSSLALVMFLERRGYLKRFASSKSNSSRISFANPAYLKDQDTTGNGADGDLNVTWETGGHSLDVLGPLPNVASNSNSDQR